MKYIILVADGMADRPIPELGGKTPVEAAKLTNIPKLIPFAKIGTVKNAPEGMYPGSDVCNLSLLGYDPRTYYTGRAPLEALSMRIPLGPEDVALRCNLVNLSYTSDNKVIMKDFSAGHITTPESHEIIATLKEKLDDDQFTFHPGVSYRHIVIWHGGTDHFEATPPHDITGRDIAEYMPKGERDFKLRELMLNAGMVLKNHPANKARRASGKLEANSIWLWGQGRTPTLPSFKDQYHLTGSVVTAVDLVKGLGVGVGLDVIDVPGATGYIDTNYEGKADAVVSSLEDHDFCFCHIEAPDEAGHNGDLKAKIQAIEDIDSRVVGRIVEKLKGRHEFNLLILSDHPTPIELKTHSADPVFYLMYHSSDRYQGGGLFSEQGAAKLPANASPSGADLFKEFISFRG